MNRCELCSNIARIFCKSDNASLCYDCDNSVHSANFLVGKHSRTLLCRKCQSPTPWTASGLHLGRTATVCVDCLDDRRVVVLRTESSHPEIQLQENLDVDDDDDDAESSGESENDYEDAENQVVPWSSVASPPDSASSTSEEFSSIGCFRSPIKGQRRDRCSDSEDDTLCSSERCYGGRTEIDDAISLTSFRPLKVMRTEFEASVKNSTKGFI